jgi:hypothetical protein
VTGALVLQPNCNPSVSNRLVRNGITAVHESENRSVIVDYLLLSGTPWDATRKVEGLVSARTWRFKSPLRHPKIVGELLGADSFESR